MHEEERTPPARIRVTRLQEAQLLDLVRIDEAAALRCAEAGLDPAAAKPRTDVDIASLHRSHDVYVAEADHIVAGYLAWRDVPPKVASLDILAVAPDYQRFGVASRLLRELGERCAELEIRHVVTRCWDDATWAMAFLTASGFVPVTQPGSPQQPGAPTTPEPVVEWLERHATADDQPRPGERVLWRTTDRLGIKVIPGVPLPA